MTINAGLFTSRSDEWETPQLLFDRLNAEFHFTLDAAASSDNHKCWRYFTKEDDALKQDWYFGYGFVYLNPPYGKIIGAFLEKAYHESQLGCTVVCLLPSRTDSRWFQEWVFRAAKEVLFFERRLKFGGQKNSAPFPSALALFGRGTLRPFRDLGELIDLDHNRCHYGEHQPVLTSMLASEGTR